MAHVASSLTFATIFVIAAAFAWYGGPAVQGIVFRYAIALMLIQLAITLFFECQQHQPRDQGGQDRLDVDTTEAHEVRRDLIYHNRDILAERMDMDDPSIEESEVDSERGPPFEDPTSFQQRVTPEPDFTVPAVRPRSNSSVSIGTSMSNSSYAVLSHPMDS